MKSRITLGRSFFVRSFQAALPGMGCTLVMAMGMLSPAIAMQINGLESPHSVLADPANNSYYISNVNGEPDARDNNGFITKLNGQAEIVGFKFISGGEQGTTLHAPKGMAFIDQVLYVADVDTLRAFDKNSGKTMMTIAMTSSPLLPARPLSLIDIAANDQGLLFVSDMPGNTIYKVDTKQRHAVSVFIHDERLAGPAGVAVHPKTGHIIVVSWEKGSILDISQDGVLTELVSNSFFTSRFQNLSGIDFDRWGNMYVSDLTKGKVWRMQPNKKFQVIAEFLPAPADVGIDRVNNLILVPYQQANVAEVNGLETPVGATGENRKRTLADYGFVAPPKQDKSERTNK
ncbi:MAG TPA: hypothetical protein VFB56_10490 [Nitrospiraceae bacterium]|nr:hypothetical protein [Nitrospiraceae bacterium]